MNALDSPLEALALNYLSHGFLTAINNIWAWIAVVTAAVSFWRIRASSSSPVSQRSRSQDGTSTSSAALPPPKMAEPAATMSNSVKRPRLSAQDTSSFCGLERECDSKTKFTLYYKVDDIREDDTGGKTEDDGGEAVAVSETSGGFRDDWERMMVVRMGNMGWYRWQDTAVLDDSVVRLWDRRRRRHVAALVVDGGVGW